MPRAAKAWLGRVVLSVAKAKRSKAPPGKGLAQQDEATRGKGKAWQYGVRQGVVQHSKGRAGQSKGGVSRNGAKRSKGKARQGQA